MARISIQTVNGTKVTIEGESKEVVFIINEIEDREAQRLDKRERMAMLRNKRRNDFVHGVSKTGILRNLLENGFFDEPRRIGDISKQLEEMKMSTPSTTIHPLLLRLVNSGELRRIKSEEGFLEYSKVNKMRDFE